jgi:hypothetical protein
MNAVREKIKACKAADDFTHIAAQIATTAGLTAGAALKLKHELIDAADAAGFVYDRTAAGFVAKPTEQAEQPGKAE